MGGWPRWLVCVFLVVGVSFSHLSKPGIAAENWKELKGENFIVFYLEDAAFAQQVLTRAAVYYRKIASDLGYSRYDNFWQWENRAKIYLYRDHAAFLQATEKKSWIHGTAYYEKKEIVSYHSGQGFMEILLPHELCHLIFRDFVGFKGEVPLWMDEGVAQWQEAGKRKWASLVVRKLIEKKETIPFIDLMLLGPQIEKDPVMTAKFYAEAVTLVGFLIEKYGPLKFISFCRELRDGKDLNAALSFVYTESIPDIQTLEKKWLTYYGGSQ